MLPSLYYTANYSIGISLFLRSLGLVFAIAFFALGKQAKGLYGRQGILPIVAIDPILFKFSVFSLSRSDRAITGFAWAGCVFSLLLALGAAPPLMLLLILVIYHSFLQAGGDFLSFQWDVLLIEIGFMAFFLSLAMPAVNLILLAFWIFLTRFMISAGVVKLRSGDPNWRNLTATKVHYQTQPLPNPVAWHMYQLPLVFHQISSLLMFLTELIVPVFFFFNGAPQVISALLVAGLQLVLILTGNFSFLNYLTLSLCFLLIPDSYWPPVAEFMRLPPFSTGDWAGLIMNIAGAIYIGINLAQLLRFIWSSRALRRFLGIPARTHLSNPYGLFAVMTTKRYELSIEGSEDFQVWVPYKFRYKPEDINRRPVQIAPYHPRLDWQMWFAALDPMHEPFWLRRLLMQLLNGSKEVLSLLRENPFEDSPPRYIRIVVYDYQFTNRAEKKLSGSYWKRRLVAVHKPHSLPPRPK